MNKTFKKILCSLLVVVVCLTSAPLQGFVDFDWSWLDFSVKSSALAETGQCGENVFWNYNSEIGELVISGTGDMWDYIYSSSAPFTDNTIRRVIIEEGVTSIGTHVFYYGSFSYISIPSSVKTINNWAFGYCHNLEYIIIPNGVEYIGIQSIYSCGNLKDIYISATVKSIESGALSGNVDLEKIIVDKNSDYYCSDENGVLFTKDKSTLVQYTLGSKCESYTIPNGVKTIANASFENAHNLINVIIPDGVVSIDDRAFDFCSNLISVDIAGSVKNIGADIFRGCYKLNDIILGDGITKIGSVMFESCNFTKIYIPESVTSIGYWAFGYCKNLQEINFPKLLSEIEGYAFRDCDSLENIVLYKNVKKIGEAAFLSCDNLKDVVIYNGLETIDAFAFRYCNKLESIVIPNSVKTIGKWAFELCSNLENVYYTGTEEQWKKISVDSYNEDLLNATIHYNYKPAPCFVVSSDTYSVDSIHRKETATYKIHLLDQNSSFLPIDNVTVQNNTEYIVDVSTKKVSDTELELTVKPLSNGDASISLFNGDNSNPQYFNFTVYSNTTTYRADQVPVTNEKLKTNFSRGDLTVDNFEYKFDENKGKYIATMDVYNSSGAIGVVAAYTQDGLISEIEQVDPYVPLPGDFGEFLVYLGTGAVGILKGENWNYRFAGDSQKTSIEIEVPEDGYLTVSCDISADEAVLIYNTVSIGVKTAFKTAEIIDYLGTDTDKLAKEASKTIVRKTSEYFKSKKGKDWVGKALSKISKKMSKQFSVAYLEDMSMLSFDMLEEICQNIGTDFSTLFFEVIDELIQEEIKSFGVMSVSKKLIKDKVIGVAERNLMKVASAIFEGGEYINFANELLGTYLYNTGTGKTMVVFKPKGEDGFICKDTIKVTSDIITDEVLLHTYIIKDTQKEDAFVRKTIYSDFNRGDGLRKEELSIDLNRIVEIHEISLWKNGQEVFDTFTATVEMNLPSYIDRRTCSIYRVEKDGTYTKLDTKIEGNKIIFETNHFSEYILTGVVEDLQETTPCDVHVYDEVRVEPSCTEEGSITYTCYCGDTYTETIEPTGHDFEGSKCTNCDYDKADDCSCNCHKNGIAKFFFKIILFFQKIFKTNQTCSCGVNHY